MTSIRGLGWDIDTSYSSNRGDLFPVGTSYGHTGFTGTSLWIDPSSNSYVIFLVESICIQTVSATSVCFAAGSRRSQPRRSLSSDGGSRDVEASDAFSGLSDACPSCHRSNRRSPVLTGIDVLARDGFKQLRGKRVGLITNHTGRSRDGKSTIDLLHSAPGVTLVSLFSPEHGIRGILDANVPAEK